MYTWIIGLIVSLVAIFLLYKFARGVLRIVGFAFLVLSLFLAVITIMVFLDVRDMQNHANEPTSFYLVKGDKIVSGISMVQLQEPDIMSQQRIDAANKFFVLGNLKDINPQSYKLYFIKYESVKRDLNILGKVMPEEQVAQKLDSKDTPDQVKTAIFTGLIFEQIIKDPSYLFLGYREGSIQVYPETPLYWVIKYAPLFIYEKAKSLRTDQISKTESVEI